jgi:hypothetical protein
MPRFVILEHDHPELHWDLMLEVGEVLRTWRLTAPPATGQAVAGEAIADHRRMYLDYEGPVGGNRGAVQRWDAGTYEGGLPTEIRPGEEIAFEFQGGRICGPAVLRFEGEERWTLQVGGSPKSGSFST